MITIELVHAAMQGEGHVASLGEVRVELVALLLRVGKDEDTPLGAPLAQQLQQSPELGVRCANLWKVHMCVRVRLFIH